MKEVKFEIEYFIDGSWTKQVNIYKVDLEKIDLKTDWRFKDVPGKRRNCIVL